MRLNYLAMRPVLLCCAFVAITSCSTDERETEAGLAPSMNLTATAVSAYDIVKVPSMTVDGNLSDWSNITAISMADNSGRTGGVDNTAKVKLAWNDTYLYAAYDVTDTELLAAQTTRDHGDIYKDDAVELYIDPQGDGSAATSMTSTDYQFLANLRDALGDAKGDGTGGKNASYNAASFLAKAVTNGTLNASGTDVGYTVEARIAWADLGVTPAAGNFMRIDPAVDDDDTTGASPEYFDWANLTIFNNPSGWKDVQLVNPPPPVSAYDIVKVPGMTIDGKLSDWRGVSAISMADDPGNGRGSLNNSAEVKLAWDPTYLYVSYDVEDTELLAEQTARDGAGLYKDDAVELYLDPQGDGAGTNHMTSTDYQLLANVREAVADMNGDGAGGKSASWNALSLFAQAVANGDVNGTGADTDYAIEMRVKWSEIGVTPGAGNFMRIDLAVDDRDGAALTAEYFDWANLGNNFNNPGGWKDVQLVVDATAPVAPTNLSLTVVSSSQIDVSWTASTSSDVAKYNIYRATTGTPTLYKTVTVSPYQDTGLTAGTSYTYQISAVDAAGNESSKTPEQSAATGGTGGAPMLVGIYDGFSLIGKGPRGDTLPHYGALHGIPATTSDLPRIIADAQAANVHLILNLVHSPSTFTKTGTDGCKTFYWDRVGNPGDANYVHGYLPWLDEARALPGNPVGAALAEGRASVFVIDEPLHPTYCGRIRREDVNRMGRETKARFPGARTIVRAASNVFSSGTEPPQGGWTAIDYGMAQYGRYPTGSTLQGETPGAYFRRQKETLAEVNVGMIPGLNLWDGGGGAQQNSCWDYQNTGSSSGRIHGSLRTNVTDGHKEGVGEACGVTPTGTYWVTNPAVIRETIDSAFADPDFPVFTMWTHILDNFHSSDPLVAPRFQALEGRRDFVEALDYVITKAASRTASNGWRPTKP